jgi:hypothetical protein
MGAPSHRQAGLHGRLAVYLAAPDQRGGRLRQPFPARLRSRSQRRPQAAEGGGPGPADYGREKVGPLYEAIGTQVFDTGPDDRHDRGSRTFLEPVLAHLGLPAAAADALDDTSLDAELQRETDEALGLTGGDVGTPFIHFQPPDGVAFFGPVISRLPDEADATRLWDHVVGLASFPGFAELKRSLRERPQLASFGVDTDQVGLQEDWHGGSRRTKT